MVTLGVLPVLAIPGQGPPRAHTCVTLAIRSVHWIENQRRRRRRSFHATHPWLSQPSLSAGNKYHTADEDQDREYSMLYNAMLIGGANRQIDQALVSASYGRFQTMGFNYDVSGGWPNVRSFVTSMFISEAQHLRAFVGFIRTNKLQTALQKQDWAGFASRYNGPSYAENQYIHIHTWFISNPNCVY